MAYIAERTPRTTARPVSANHRFIGLWKAVDYVALGVSVAFVLAILVAV